MCQTNRVILPKIFSEKYNCMHLTTQLYGIPLQDLSVVIDSVLLCLGVE